MKSHNLTNRHEAEQKQPDAFYSGSPKNREHDQNDGFDCKTVSAVAGALATKRRELINQPLDRIWPDLARAAIEAYEQARPAPVQLHELSDEDYAAFVEAMGGNEPPTPALIALMKGYDTNPARAALAAMPATDAVRDPAGDLDFEAIANGNDRLLSSLAAIVISDQAGSHCLMATAEAALNRIARVEAELAALSQPAMPSWQPIETAPKDGTKIDLLYPYPRGRTIDCFWRRDEFTGPDGCWGWLSPAWGAELLPEAEWNWSSYPNMQPTPLASCPRPARGQAMSETKRLADAEKIIDHILATAPWNGEEAHKQLLKEAREYDAKYPKITSRDERGSEAS